MVTADIFASLGIVDTGSIHPPELNKMRIFDLAGVDVCFIPSGRDGGGGERRRGRVVSR